MILLMNVMFIMNECRFILDFIHLRSRMNVFVEPNGPPHAVTLVGVVDSTQPTSPGASRRRLPAGRDGDFGTSSPEDFRTADSSLTSAPFGSSVGTLATLKDARSRLHKVFFGQGEHAVELVSSGNFYVEAGAEVGFRPINP